MTCGRAGTTCVGPRLGVGVVVVGSRGLSGVEHYREAEHHLRQAGLWMSGELSAHHVAVAQVHATLALVGAVLDARPVDVGVEALAGWGDVVSS